MCLTIMNIRVDTCKLVHATSPNGHAGLVRPYLADLHFHTYNTNWAAVMTEIDHLWFTFKQVSLACGLLEPTRAAARLPSFWLVITQHLQML